MPCPLPRIWNYSKQEAPNAQNYVRITSLHKQQSAGRSSRAKGGHGGRSRGCSPYVFSLLMQLPKKEDSLSRFSPIPVVLLKTISLLLLLRVSMKFFHFSCKRISQGESKQQSTPTPEVLNLKTLQFTMQWGRGGKFTLEFLLLLYISPPHVVVPSPSSFLTLLSFPFLGPFCSATLHSAENSSSFSHSRELNSNLQRNQKSARIARQRRQSAIEKTKFSLSLSLCFALFLQKLNSSLVTY